MPTHAEIATSLVERLPAGVFAHAARDGVIHQDFAMLKRMLPGIAFTASAVGPDSWTLAGVCADGSTAIWTVGG